MTHLTPLQNELAGALVGLARALESMEISSDAAAALQDGLCALRDADDGVIASAVRSVRMTKQRIVPDCAVCKNPCGRTAEPDMNDLPPLKHALLSAAAEYAAAHPCEQKHAEALAYALFTVGYECAAEEEITKMIDRFNFDLSFRV